MALLTKSSQSDLNVNWCKYTRQGIVNHLTQQLANVKSKRLTPLAFKSCIVTALQGYIPVRVAMRTRKFKDAARVKVGGCYYSDKDQAGQVCIELILLVRKNKAQRLTELVWNRVILLIADTIMHEIIHMRQYRSRNFEYLSCFYNDTNHSKYYSSKDEIEAFAFNIACELIDKLGPNYKSIIKVLSQPNVDFFSSLLADYYRRFGPLHPVRLSLNRQIIKNIKPASVGKPFFRSKYLTR